MDGSHTPVDRDAQRMEREKLLGALGPFQAASVTHSITQFSTTLAAYLATVVVMYMALNISIWLCLALAPLAAGLVVRLFIIQHDCGHGSYFSSQRANEFIGRLCSVITFTPYANWRRHHAMHHAMWNNLDRRDNGLDIYVTCLTLKEYLALSRFKRWLYRFGQHPIMTQFVLPPFVFLILYRTPFDTPKSWQGERRSVVLTNLTLAAVLGGLVLAFGWQTVLIVHLPIMVLASIIGVWMFAVQHRFEDVQWLRQEQWTAIGASLKGTSYLKLPAILQWFTGNIGFHHIHHLLPRVPNYRLEACHDVLLQSTSDIHTLSFRDALHAPRFTLWDEAQSRMVPFPA